MPRYEITIQRTVTSVDEFKRVIEADDETDARNIGAELAFESNGFCPDDCTSNGFFDCGSFYVASAELTDKEVDEE